MDIKRVREALAKLKAVHFPELEIDVFFEREEAVQPAGNDNYLGVSETPEAGASGSGAG